MDGSGSTGGGSGSGSGTLRRRFTDAYQKAADSYGARLAAAAASKT